MNIIPKYAQMKPKSKTPAGQKIIRGAENNYNQCELKNLHAKREHTNAELLAIHLQLAEHLPIQTLMEIIEKIKADNKKLMKKKYERCNKLGKDPTEEYQAAIKNTIKKITTIIKDNLPYRLTLMNPSVPPLIALPKAHKLGTPMRPIINYKSDPGYRLSKHLKTLLKDNLDLRNKYIFTNTTDLFEKMKSLKINENTKFVSFDIKDLYPSIPTIETIKTVQEILMEKTKREAAQEIINALKVTLKQNYFRFNNKIYKQINGLGMGNPTSAILMEVFMQTLEEKYMENLSTNLGVKFYARYVDDVICLIEGNKEKQILGYLRKQHQNIKFTMEAEEERKINYLDLTITINDTTNKIKTSAAPCIAPYTDEMEEIFGNSALLSNNHTLNVSRFRAQALGTPPPPQLADSTQPAPPPRPTELSQLARSPQPSLPHPPTELSQPALPHRPKASSQPTLPHRPTALSQASRSPQPALPHRPTAQPLRSLLLAPVPSPSASAHLYGDDTELRPQPISPQPAVSPSPPTSLHPESSQQPPSQEEEESPQPSTISIGKFIG
ncbi:arp2/3 complex-activating protein rickA-like [Rhagoletis pomonella]|uniref:arp2/3 complex-activating protein rickA-like n=1 Tax=Rhagoletis pomonella TaxID=28610 RepID=UPI00177B4703|nr:arp2/3 complex-activating protein rickA-like [Rhagoletis pomonella]